MIGNLNFEAEYSVAEILGAIEANKTAHLLDYSEAYKEYLNQVEVKLKAALKSLKKGNIPDVKAGLGLVKPVDCEKEYDKLILLFSRIKDTKVRLSTHDADSIFNDNWNWAVSAKITNSFYSSTRG